MNIKNKIKIIFLLPSLAGGGAEKVTLNYIKYLNKDIFEVILLTINKGGNYENLLPNNITVIDFKIKRARYSIFKIIFYVNKYKPDILYSTLQHTNLLILIFKFIFINKPKILIREPNTPSLYLKQLPFIKRNIFLFMHKTLYSLSNKIIVQCEEMKKDIINTYKINENKVITIYNPIDIKAILAESIKFNPYDNNFINIVSIGRLTYQKGFDILIKAFKNVNIEYPESRLTILGEGEDKVKLISLAKQLNIEKNIIFVGFQQNPYPYIRYSDVFVLSSRWEGFPNVLIEALTCNARIVSTNCKSGPKEIINNDNYGILINVDDIIGLSDAIIKQINNKCNLNVQQRAFDFDINIIINKFEGLILSLVSQNL